MLDTLQQQLPTTFRISPFAPTSINKRIQEFNKTLSINKLPWLEGAW